MTLVDSERLARLRERLAVLERRGTPETLKAEIAAESARPHPRDRKLTELYQRLEGLEAQGTIEGVRAEIQVAEQAAEAERLAAANALAEAESALLELKKSDARYCEALAAAWLAMIPAVEAGLAHAGAVRDARWRVERLKGIATIPMTYTTEGWPTFPGEGLAHQADVGAVLRAWATQRYGLLPKKR